MTGLSTHRVAAFIMLALSSDTYVIEGTDAHEFVVNFSDVATEWDSLRSVGRLSVGPPEAATVGGRVIVMLDVPQPGLLFLWYKIATLYWVL